MKKNIAIVWGGYSSESIVSEKSMNGVYSFLDKSRYNLFKVKITQSDWTVETKLGALPVDKNTFGFFCPESHNTIRFDFVFIIIHGTPGEDGKLQGYFDMMGIPYSSCGMMAAALTFNKYICNNFLRNFDINVAKSLHLFRKGQYANDHIVRELGLPVFVKPNVGGSSFATTKVKSADELDKAIEEAFSEAPEVIVESFIKGREVTCGCYKTSEGKTVLPLTEVITSNEFFDYKAKYEGEVSEITPAQLSENMTQAIQRETMRIYDLIGAKGIIRVDYIIAEDNVSYMLEVNTTPGMTPTSFIPQQIAAANLNITDVLSGIIETEYNRNI